MASRDRSSPTSGGVEGAAWQPPVAAFVDDQGTRWDVRELDGASIPGARGDRCLCFVSSGVVRRVWSYPVDWRALPPADLLKLSWGR